MTARFSRESADERPTHARIDFGEIYEQSLVGPLFRPWVAPLLDDVEFGPHDALLDVACGTGIVARVASERLGPGGRVVGVDLNPQMLAVARRVAPAIDWRQGDAGALPLGTDERFDVVVCQQGFQFFPDRAAAARQMHRALASGGRLGLSSWQHDDEFGLLRSLREIAERHLGPIADRRYGLGDPVAVERVLGEAGFHDIRSRQITRTLHHADGPTFVRLNAMALVGMSAAFAALDDKARQRLVATIVDDSADLLGRQTDAAGLALEIGTHVVLARA